MVGTKVMLRLRMSAVDAHYAGELVDGARMLALFGDLATELLIRLDGDEGLFRAYESVEFLAPVFAGDYIEATAELVAIGNTSRKMRFEARKVIANLRGADAPPSAADVLSEPIVVCRAVGTCVVPKHMQRRPRELYMPATACRARPPSAGARHAASRRRGDPHRRHRGRRADTGANEPLADHAPRDRRRGGALPRGRRGRHPPARAQRRRAHTRSRQSASREAIDAIRRQCDCIVQPSTGGAVGMSIEERAGPLACRPEMATLNCGTINFGDDVFVNTRPDIRELARAIRAADAVPELECYEVGHVEEALSLAAEGAIAHPLHFQFVLGIPGGIPAREDVVQFMRSLVPPEATWAVAAVGRSQQPMTELAMRLGGHARVGLEDNIYLSKGVLSEGSAPLVARAAAYARSIGRPPADPAQAQSDTGHQEPLRTWWPQRRSWQTP